jgi:hypothetical protein
VSNFGHPLSVRRERTRRDPVSEDQAPEELPLKTAERTERHVLRASKVYTGKLLDAREVVTPPAGRRITGVLKNV